MAIARHGVGASADVQALVSQIHPVFMLPPLATSAFGAVVAGTFAPPLLALHLAAVFFALYTAHIKDGYVDFHVRGEDDDHPMTIRGCRLALVAASLGFFAALAAITYLAGVVAGLLTLPMWLIAYLHAPQLDTHPVTVTVGYPAGIAVALVSSFYLQSGTVTPIVLAFAAVLLVVLTGVKTVDDETDYDYDRSIDKRTVAVVLGRRAARRFAYALMGVGTFAVVAFAVDGIFPASAPAAAAAFGVVALLARRADAELATMLLVRGAYVLLALLVVAVWFEPLAGISLPDIGVLGPYTYLATEVVFGTAGLVLLHRAGALRRAARTVLLLYPVAYLWDWYTLEVGVFAIPLRTGVELVGIPLEEHLFIVVVPAFVLGVHETLHGDDTSDRRSLEGSTD